jgi:hypothetical protein
MVTVKLQFTATHSLHLVILSVVCHICRHFLCWHFILYCRADAAYMVIALHGDMYSHVFPMMCETPSALQHHKRALVCGEPESGRTFSKSPL